VSTEAKVGIFILAGIVLLAGSILKLGDVTLKRQYPLTVRFRDVAGLPDKSVVKLSGVEVGKVRRIRLIGDGAVVDIGVDRGVEIYRDAKFRVGSTSIIGSKFLQIDQGTPQAGVIAPGSQVQGEDTQPLERLMADALKSVQGLIDELKGSLGKEGSLMKNLDASAFHLRQLTANMKDLMADVKPHLTRALERSDGVIEKLDRILAKTDELLVKLNTSTGTVGALISDREMKEQVKATVSNFRDASASAKDVLGRFGQFRFYWNVGARSEPEAKATKGDIGLRIVPRPGKFYYLGGTNLGGTANIPKGTDYEQKNTIDAVLGWYGKWWEFYGGAIRSTFGAGGRLIPFPDIPWLERLSLFAQAYDFGRNRTILSRKFDTPVYDAGADLKVHRYLRIGARVQDLAEIRHYQTTATVSFEDKDVAYFFGLVSFSATTRTSTK